MGGIFHKEADRREWKLWLGGGDNEIKSETKALKYKKKWQR